MTNKNKHTKETKKPTFSSVVQSGDPGATWPSSPPSRAWALRQKLRIEIVEMAENEGLELNNQQIDERVDRAINRRTVRSLLYQQYYC